MSTWGEILGELNLPTNRLANGRPDFDGVRRRYLAALSHLTGRPVIVYATAFLDKDVQSNDVQINLGDLQGFMQAVAGVQQRSLDLMITSPGGSAEATESIVSYLRTHFDHIRAFVPIAAMSAATMLALGSDEIVMGTHSQLGPIDPQFMIGTPEGPRAAPAQAILDQFKQAKRDCRNPQNLSAWMPIIRGYGPGLLAQCASQRRLAERMVTQWLQDFMLRGDPEAGAKAEKAAKWFANYRYFGSHGRRVSLEDVASLGLRVAALEDDDNLQDAVLSVHHCYSHTFNGTAAVKLIENERGATFAKLVFLQPVVVQGPPRGPQATPAAPQPASRQPSRAARRRAQRGRR